MATVYLVREPGIDRLVALKVLPEQLVDDAHFAARFEQEARVIGGLDHPNIIPLYRYGIADDVPWMALRYVDGGDLAGRLAGAPVSVPAGLAILRGVADALDYAHGKGVIHRDLKPQNILLTTTGAAYLADFGVAKLLEGTLRLKTATGNVMGTPAYMAPEQAKGQPLGPYTDVYALAVVCFQWLTGSLPFDADTPHAILMKHVLEPVPQEPLAMLSPSVAAVLERGLAKEPADRFQSATALVSQLEHALYSPATRPLPAKKEQQQQADLSMRAAPRNTTAVQARRPNPVWKALAAVALAWVLMMGGYAYWLEVMKPAAEERAAQQRATDEVTARQAADAALAKRAADDAAAKKAEEKRDADKHAVEELPVNPPVINLTADAARRAQMEKLAEERRVADTAAATRTLGLSVKGISSKPPAVTKGATQSPDTGFIDLGNGVLEDTKTGLEWTQSDNGSAITWNDAKGYCESKTGGWRLPNVDELAAIYSEGEKRGDTTQCAGYTCKVSPLFHLSAYWHWSGTRVDESGSDAWYVGLGNGKRLQLHVNMYGGNQALCIRRR
jgi:hypothetical protein